MIVVSKLKQILITKKMNCSKTLLMSIEAEYCDCGENLFRFENSPTIIYGFGYDGRHIDGRCYREGMALKFFWRFGL